MSAFLIKLLGTLCTNVQSFYISPTKHVSYPLRRASYCAKRHYNGVVRGAIRLRNQTLTEAAEASPLLGCRSVRNGGCFACAVV
eukprot:3320812-Rhodomonas_salina.2